MSRVLILNKSAKGPDRARMRKTSAFLGGVFSANGKIGTAGRAEINLMSLVFAIALGACVCGAFYLYQVNDIATKGYEIRELEGKIQELDKESKRMEIHEVELRSMYNIEKASQDLNLVNSGEVTYVEINGPVAMK
ncbi:MAG: hypothetical protein U0944_02490 [Candidatus Moranbacteria bacterium]|nr:hypothetical protein [Candidatus Moranbacteria bacterium]MDZ4385266.1 hypothetical protein [Candidatus Moranbacteria bacterium]